MRDLRFDGASAAGGAERAIAIVPAGPGPWPVLVALHGRGEAVRGAEVGAYGWWRDYRLPATLAALSRGTLTDEDFGGFSDTTRLAAINRSLAPRPYTGVIVVCPHTPDILGAPRSLDGAARFGEWVVTALLPRVRAECGALLDVGIDGVSLGGRVSALVGFAHPAVFRAVGTLQPAFQGGESAEVAKRAAAYVAARKDGQVRLLTSVDDPFRPAVLSMSEAFTASAVPHEHVVVPGPHNYAFNRGPGGLEMLLWHDRVLRGQPSL